MNSKAKIVIVCGVFFFLLGGLHETEAASKKNKGIKAIKKIVDEVDNLASNGIAGSEVYAKELAKVLSKHEVSLPDKLAQLEPQQTPFPEPNDIQIERMFKPGYKILEHCKNSTWMKDPNYVLPVALRNELVTAVVDNSPSSMNRVKAAKFLVERAYPGEKPTMMPDVSALQANRACATAINHVLSEASKGKVDPHLVSGASLVLMHLMLESMTAEKPSKESLDKMLKGYTSKANAALETANDERLIKVLNNLKKGIQNAEKHTELYAQVALYKFELEPVAKAFLDAVNKEDKEKVKQYMTDEIIKLMGIKNDPDWSLRKNVTQLPDVKEIRYQGIGSIAGYVKKENKEIVKFPIMIAIIFNDGSQKNETIRAVFVKTSRGWLLGSE